MKFEPVEGNGWYVSGRRVPPPSAFCVKGTGGPTDGSIEGTVHDRTSEFDGYRVRGRPTFLEDETWLSVQLDRAESAGSGEWEPEVLGYVRVEV